MLCCVFIFIHKIFSFVFDSLVEILLIFTYSEFFNLLFWLLFPRYKNRRKYFVCFQRFAWRVFAYDLIHSLSLRIIQLYSSTVAPALLAWVGFQCWSLLIFVSFPIKIENRALLKFLTLTFELSFSVVFHFCFKYLISLILGTHSFILYLCPFDGLILLACYVFGKNFVLKSAGISVVNLALLQVLLVWEVCFYVNIKYSM